jgi:hypothetical protein
MLWLSESLAVSAHERALLRIDFHRLTVKNGMADCGEIFIRSAKLLKLKSVLQSPPDSSRFSVRLSEVHSST